MSKLKTLNQGECDCGDRFAGLTCEECSTGFTGPSCNVRIGNFTSGDYNSAQLSFRMNSPWKHIYLDMDNKETKKLTFEISNTV